MVELEIRSAKKSKDDAEKVLKWRSDEEARKTAYDGNVNWKDHWKWYKEAIMDPNKIIYFGMLECEDVGVIRFDRVNADTLQVSVYLSPVHRGKGLGANLIRNGCEKIFGESNYSKIVAEVRQENVISIKTFKEAAFGDMKLVKKKLKNGDEIPIYVLELHKKM